MKHNHLALGALVVSLLVSFAPLGVASAVVPDPAQSACALSDQIASCQYRFRADGELDVLTVAVTLRDSFGAVLPACSTSIAIVNPSSTFCAGLGSRRLKTTDDDGVVACTFRHIGGRGSAEIVVTAYCEGAEVEIDRKPFDFTSPDLDASCEREPGVATRVADLALWASCLPPGPYCQTSDYTCDGAVGIADLALFAGGLTAGTPKLLTREQAVATLLAELQPGADVEVWCPYVDFGFGPGLMPDCATLTSAAPNVSHPDTTLNASWSYVFLVDDAPRSFWSHDVRYAIVEAKQDEESAQVNSWTDHEWWLEVHATKRMDFFEAPYSELSAGASNPDGLVWGVPDPPAAGSNPRLATSPAKFRGDPCAILFTGVSVGDIQEHNFNNDLDTFDTQMTARFEPGQSAGRIFKKKSGTIQELKGLVDQVVAVNNPACDRVYVYIGSHGVKRDTTKPAQQDGALLFVPDPNLKTKAAQDTSETVTEQELAATLAPLASLNATIHIVIQGCYSGSMIQGLQDKLKSAWIYTAADKDTPSIGGPCWKDAALTQPIGQVSVFANAFQRCWDDDGTLGADKSKPKNGVDWREAFRCVSDKNETLKIYYDRNPHPVGIDRPLDAHPQNPTPPYRGHALVADKGLAAGQATSVGVWGSHFEPKNQRVFWALKNGRTGLRQRSPVQGVDSKELLGLTSSGTIDVLANGRLRSGTSQSAQFPGGANPGDVAVYKLFLAIEDPATGTRHTVAVNYGSATVKGAGRPGVRVAGGAGGGNNRAGVSSGLTYWVYNEEVAPVSFTAQLNAFNDHDDGFANLVPFSGMTPDSGAGTPTVYGTTESIAPGDSLAIQVQIAPDASGVDSDFSVDLALWNTAIPTAAINASDIVQPTVPAPFADVTNGPIGDAGPSSGVAWVDFDEDGDHDLFVANWAEPNRLYRNDGGATFAEVAGTPLAGNGRTTGMSWVDFDNDDDLDVFLANEGIGESNRLIQNDGNGIFLDVTPAILGDTGAGRGASWGDSDADGLVDLYVSRRGSPNHLYRNDGGTVFVDATSGPLGDSGAGTAAAWADFDGDGDLDVYVTNDGDPDLLLRNDGAGAFEDVTPAAAAAADSSQGACWGDYDNDGDLDLYVCVAGGSNVLLANEGGGAFSDETTTALADGGDSQSGIWGDYDNDGDLDLFVTNRGQANRLFVNEGAGAFLEIAETPSGDLGDARGAAWGDHDADGDLDLYVANFDGSNILYENLASSANHWLQLDLEGVSSNRSGIGAWVIAVAGGQAQLREVGSSHGLWSQNSATVQFGLGASTVADSVVIHWPSGIEQVLTAVPADQRLTIVESGGSTAKLAGEGIGTPAGSATFELSRSAPNPFREATAIQYFVPRTSEVNLRVFDVTGRLVRVLESDRKEPGQYKVRWDGRNGSGKRVSSGVYFYRLDSEDIRRTRRMVLLK